MIDPQPIRVMCVEDNPVVRDALRLILDRAGSFEWVGDLAAADRLVEAVARSRPDVVVLDVDMPGRDPLGVLAELSRECPQVRTVIYTGHVRPDLLERAFSAGAWGYVGKDQDTTRIVSALHRVFHGEVSFETGEHAADQPLSPPRDQ